MPVIDFVVRCWVWVMRYSQCCLFSMRFFGLEAECIVRSAASRAGNSLVCLTSRRSMSHWNISWETAEACCTETIHVNVHVMRLFTRLRQYIFKTTRSVQFLFSSVWAVFLSRGHSTETIHEERMQHAALKHFIRNAALKQYLNNGSKMPHWNGTWQYRCHCQRTCRAAREVTVKEIW